MGVKRRSPQSTRRTRSKEGSAKVNGLIPEVVPDQMVMHCSGRSLFVTVLLHPPQGGFSGTEKKVHHGAHEGNEDWKGQFLVDGFDLYSLLSTSKDAPTSILHLSVPRRRNFHDFGTESHFHPVTQSLFLPRLLRVFPLLLPPVFNLPSFVSGNPIVAKHPL